MSENKGQYMVANPMRGVPAAVPGAAVVGATDMPRASNATTDVAVAREQAEVQGMILLAKRFPRNTVQAMDRILNACTRPTLAEAAVYQYERGGTDVTGPSIRLAEAIAQNWGNIQFGVRELEQRNGESTCEAFAWDLETNVRQSKVFQVPHIRHTKRGSYALQNPRDIYEMVANQGARRVRSCILGVIPGDVVDTALAQCEATLKSSHEITPERIKGLVEKFGEYGVSKAQIEARIQRRIDTITSAQLVNLGKIYNSIRDGMSNPADWFEAETEKAAEAEGEGKTDAKPAGKLSSAVRKKAEEFKKPEPESKELFSERPPVDERTWELIQDTAESHPEVFRESCRKYGVDPDELMTAPADALKKVIKNALDLLDR